MVFLNMGGPSTVGEVEDFLKRLFVSAHRPAHTPAIYSNNFGSKMAT